MQYPPTTAPLSLLPYPQMSLSFQNPSRVRPPGLGQSPNTSWQSDTPGRSAWRQFRRSLPLGDFFCAMSLISLILFTGFFAMSWVVVVRGTQSVGDRVLYENTTGVGSIRISTGQTLLTVGAVVAPSVWTWLSTGLRNTHIISTVDTRHVRWCVIQSPDERSHPQELWAPRQGG